MLLACLLAPNAYAQLSTRVHASGFSTPIAFVQDPVSSNVQYVVEQGGRVRVVRDGTVLAADFLNLTSAVLSGGERGLLGLAFDPGYASNGRFFVNFTNTLGHTVGPMYCNGTATRLGQDRTEQKCSTADGVEIRLFMGISLTGKDKVGSVEAHS